MKFIDCFMYYDEDMILDIRLNILDKFVSYFVICEANYLHNGSKKEFKFDINKFPKFKDKIIYIPLEQQPKNLRIINNSDNLLLKNSKILDNALLRENFQRDFLHSKIKNFDDNDFIIISDVDEIPNLEKFKYKSKITFFEQKMFYYKFNLYYKDYTWLGTKATKKKNFYSPQWLRNIKGKKYSRWRLDTLFSKKKYSNLYFIKNGGWHFTCLRTPEELEKKLLNFAHHYEFEESGLKIEDLKKLISEKRVMYDHNVDQRGYKWSGKSILKKVKHIELPSYVTNNLNLYKEWLD